MAGGGANETRILSAGEVARWYKSATPGDTLVYCTGPAMLPGPTLDLLLALVREKKAVTHKRRAAGDGPLETRSLEHYLVVLRRPRPARAAAGPNDEPLEAIFDSLSRAAMRGRACPSDAELARIAELGTRHQAAWRMRKLEKSGRIATECIDTPGGVWRIVTIVATGKSTAARPLAAGVAA